MTLRLHAMTCGWITMLTSTFLRGEKGYLAVPIPSPLIDHPKRVVLFDVGHDRIEIDGEHDIFGDGSVTCLPTYGHTPGHQSLRVKLEGGTVVLTADACYMRRSMEDLHLPGVILDAEMALATYRRFAAMEAAGARLIFGHDPQQWNGLNDGEVREITFGAGAPPQRTA